jgi:hypothetical protein
MNTDAFLPYVSLVRELSHGQLPGAARMASVAAAPAARLGRAALRTLRNLAPLERVAKAMEQPVSVSRTYAVWHRMLEA